MTARPARPQRRPACRVTSAHARGRGRPIALLSDGLAERRRRARPPSPAPAERVAADHHRDRRGADLRRLPRARTSARRPPPSAKTEASPPPAGEPEEEPTPAEECDKQVTFTPQQDQEEDAAEEESRRRPPTRTAPRPEPPRRRSAATAASPPTCATPTARRRSRTRASWMCCRVRRRPSGVPNFIIRKFRVPPFLLPIYQAAGIEYGIRWEVLAAINEIETDYGRNLNVSSAGAVGWMQFIPSTWRMYGTDANEDGRKDPYNPVDAIFAAARYLAGGRLRGRRAPRDLRLQPRRLVRRLGAAPRAADRRRARRPRRLAHRPHRRPLPRLRTRPLRRRPGRGHRREPGNRHLRPPRAPRSWP